MKEYNIVTNYKVMSEIKKSKYFKVNLGMSVSFEKNGERVLSDKDKFSVSYNHQYKTTIYSQGKIGGMTFYVDHGIKDDKLAFYHELEEFVFDFDKNIILEKGIDSYLGILLKRVDQEFEKILK